MFRTFTLQETKDITLTWEKDINKNQIKINQTIRYKQNQPTKFCKAPHSAVSVNKDL